MFITYYRAISLYKQTLPFMRQLLTILLLKTFPGNMPGFSQVKPAELVTVVHVVDSVCVLYSVVFDSVQRYHMKFPVISCHVIDA